MTHPSPVKTEWTLFLDRDGVINQRLPGDYVKMPDQFIFIEGVKPALAKLRKIFPTIIVVTNQQGIGKGLMSEPDLELIHRAMQDEVVVSGGRIDAVFYCPALDTDGHPDRKPASGMALRAKQAFPEIQFNKAIMVGDSESDILFGKNLGMLTVYLTEEQLDQDFGADYHFENLSAFADWLDIHQKSILL